MPLQIIVAGQILDIGAGTVPADDFARLRRLRIINAVAALAALVTLAYMAFYAVYDWWHFRREIAFLPVMALLYLGTFLLNRAGRIGAATWWLPAVALFHLGAISWMLGKDAGALSYLLVVPFLLALLTGERDRLSVWPVALAVGGMFVLVSFTARSGSVTTLPAYVQTWIFILNSFGAIFLSCVVAVLFRWTIQRAESDLEAERRRSDRLLRAILPEPIIRRLKSDRRQIIAQEIPEATAVFADIVGFTRWSMQTPAADVVRELNRIFSHIDRLCAARGLEKIKTIGDEYFAVAGVPETQPDHAARAADFALDLAELARGWQTDSMDHLRFRIVIASGPVVAGVIGRAKFAYDVWGNTINTAARMEAACAPGGILIDRATKRGLPLRFRCESVGTCDLREQRAVELFRLLSRRPPDHPAAEE